MTLYSSNDPAAVCLEVGQKRMFACALAWPGWCRSGKTEEQALETLAAYAERYAVVARQAGISFAVEHRNPFQIVERRTGSAGYTDYGVPGAIAAGDRLPWLPEEAERSLALLAAAWMVFDRVAATVSAELKKGPRGGGRDRDQLIDHVLGAETAYARKLGVTRRQPSHDDTADIAALRASILAASRTPDAGAERKETDWPPRYAVRRIAWHILDHAWEMEDRNTPPSSLSGQ